MSLQLLDGRNVKTVAWIGTWAASYSNPGLDGLVYTFFVVHGGILAAVRSSFCAQYNLRSNVVADLMGIVFFKAIRSRRQSQWNC